MMNSSCELAGDIAETYILFTVTANVEHTMRNEAELTASAVKREKRNFIGLELTWGPIANYTNN